MSTHTCPVPGGDREVSDSMLMCRKHWFTVPKALRVALYAAWQNGAGQGSVEHYAAMAACVRAADASVRCS